MLSNGSQQNGLPDFSLAFQQMCGIFAISKTKNPRETLQNLILQTLAILQDERFFAYKDLGKAIYAIFNLHVQVHEIEIAVQTLLTEKKVTFDSGSYIKLQQEIRNEKLQEIKLAEELELRVKRDWLADVKRDYPLIPPEPIWATLKEYLAKSFRRHGIQAVAMLNPMLKLSGEVTKNLSTILQEITRVYSSEIQSQAIAVISKFMAEAPMSTERTKYITQIADGAFNFFSLATSPEVADKFRQELSPLTIFLDTNFLFGILDFSTGPHVEVSNELMSAIDKFNFPFKLKYHEQTRNELSKTIGNYRLNISSQRLSVSLAKAAVKSPYISGVEHRYYERHLEEGITPEDFFRPFTHFDELLKKKKIVLYIPSEKREREISILFKEYEDYLGAHSKEKSDGLIMHDVSVLDEVRRLRSKSDSSLKAEALLLTCDYQLYLFDNDDCRRKHILPSTVLPNLFWQILRPFIPADIDFDRAFAGTFAIPEFRTIGSGSASACSKALNILNSYKDFPESTAIRLLSNDILMEQLQASKDDVEFRQVLESAIVDENNSLIEEKFVLQRQFEKEQEEANNTKVQLEIETKERNAKEAEAGLYKTELDEYRKKVMQELEIASSKLDAEKSAKGEIEKNSKTIIENSKKEVVLYKVISAIMISLFLIALFELLVNLLPWGWVLNHPHTLALQLSCDMLFLTFVFGFFFPKRRPWLWRTAGLSFLVCLLSIL